MKSVIGVHRPTHPEDQVENSQQQFETCHTRRRLANQLASHLNTSPSARLAADMKDV